MVRRRIMMVVEWIVGLCVGPGHVLLGDIPPDGVLPPS